ncbi:MAG: hypothetical protein PHO37_02700 [Kiritimatiellae bacterium]|nr:hypothetical protein [Kiritimatiellia bacterium]
MGTSINYLGSPNWGPAKSETTRVGGQGHVTPQKAASIVKSFVDQMQQASQLGFGTPLSSQRDGFGVVSRDGKDRHRGGVRGTRRPDGSARTVARRIGGFLGDVHAKGFRNVLSELGFTDITNKSPDEIAFALADFFGGPASLIEQTALRGALMELVLEWSEGVQEIEGLIESVTNAAENIEDTLYTFFGHYIFEVFKTVGYQGVLATHGFEKAESMVDQIRDFINAKIAGVKAERELSSVNWNSIDGAAIVDGIVTDTIAIFG